MEGGSGLGVGGHGPRTVTFSVAPRSHLFYTDCDSCRAKSYTLAGRGSIHTHTHKHKAHMQTRAHEHTNIHEHLASQVRGC